MACAIPSPVTGSIPAASPDQHQRTTGHARRRARSRVRRSGGSCSLTGRCLARAGAHRAWPPRPRRRRRPRRRSSAGRRRGRRADGRPRPSGSPTRSPTASRSVASNTSSERSRSPGTASVSTSTTWARRRPAPCPSFLRTRLPTPSQPTTIARPHGALRRRDHHAGLALVAHVVDAHAVAQLGAPRRRRVREGLVELDAAHDPADGARATRRPRRRVPSSAMPSIGRDGT